MFIHASSRLTAVLRKYLSEVSFQDIPVAIIHVGKLTRGRYDHEGDLRIAYQKQQEGYGLVLLGRSPRHDYEQYPLFRKIMQKPNAMFLPLGRDISQSLKDAIARLYA